MLRGNAQIPVAEAWDGGVRAATARGPLDPVSSFGIAQQKPGAHEECCSSKMNRAGVQGAAGPPMGEAVEKPLNAPDYRLCPLA